MMRTGFEFDASLCVGCSACRAACILENGLPPDTRSLFRWNGEAVEGLAVLSISMACNHCENPGCMEGCPTSAYRRDERGRIILETDSCMGCRYCTWKCPFDAPVINTLAGYAEKCHLCYARVDEGYDPACVSACPTGALKMTTIERFPESETAWMPGKSLRPSLILKNTGITGAPEIIPREEDPEPVEEPGRRVDSKITREWSLLLFTFLVISASSLIITSLLFRGESLNYLPPLLLASAILFSFAHLGVPAKGWRAPLNFISSPLSREIIMVMILTAAAFGNWLLGIFPGRYLMSGIALLTLVTVDMVYYSADKSARIRLHTGQAFFSAIFMTSWSLSNNTLFLVLSILAAISVVTRYSAKGRSRLSGTIYYIRAVSLPVVLLLLYPGIKALDMAASLIFIAGIFADRALFYDDFNPENIKLSITEHFTGIYEEKGN